MTGRGWLPSFPAMAPSAEMLHGEALRAAVAPWREEVGKADRDRLDALVRIATAERTRLSECIRATFPDLMQPLAM